MKVLIAGGGIAGPAAGIALAKAGIGSEIHEAYPREAGDGSQAESAGRGADGTIRSAGD